MSDAERPDQSPVGGGEHPNQQLPNQPQYPTQSFPSATQHWASGPRAFQRYLVPDSSVPVNYSPVPTNTPATPATNGAAPQGYPQPIVGSPNQLRNPYLAVTSGQPFSSWSPQAAPGQVPPGQLPPGQLPPGQFPPPPYSGPSNVPPAKPARRNPVVTSVALLLAFLLGMGTFAVGGQVIATFNPPAESSQPEQNWPAPNPDVPQPKRADSSVTPEQSKGVALISGQSGSSQSSGTGIVLTADGKVLTNYHVVAGTESIKVTIADTGKTYQAKVLGFDQEKDVALLQLKAASGLETVTIDNDPIYPQSRVSVVGNANGGGELVRVNGTVTGLHKNLTVSSSSPWGAEADLNGLIESNANAVPGDSGGPTFDEENEVTGITTAGSESESVTYSIPIADALAIVKTIEAGKDVNTTRVGPAGYIGIVVVPASKKHKIGRQIQDISADGPAALAGITAGSILTRIGKTSIFSDTNLARVIRGLEPGETIQVAWIDPTSEEHTAEVTLGSSPIN